MHPNPRHRPGGLPAIACQLRSTKSMSPQAKNLLDVATAFAELYIKINIKADNRDHETLKKIIIASYVAGVYSTAEVVSESRLSPTDMMSACHEVSAKLGFSIKDVPTE